MIYDFNTLEMDLMKSGVSSIAYWNVWRLTPSVYRKSNNSHWVIKNDFRKTDTDGIKDRAEYVLYTTTEILLAADENQSRTRSPDYRRYYLVLKRDGVPVYSKASKVSAIAQITTTGVRKLYSDYSIDGIDGSGTFWHVVHWEDDAKINGFVHEDEVES